MTDDKRNLVNVLTPTDEQREYMEALSSPRLNPDKGLRGGSCNVTACQRPGALYFNKSTCKYYCRRCADEINWPGGRADTMALYGVPLLCELDAPGTVIELKTDSLADAIDQLYVVDKKHQPYIRGDLKGAMRKVRRNGEVSARQLRAYRKLKRMHKKQQREE